MIDELENKVLTGCGRCPHTNIYATGIPSHLVDARGLEEHHNTNQSENSTTLMSATKDETIQMAFKKN